MVECVEKFGPELQRGILVQAPNLGDLRQGDVPVELPRAKNDTPAAIAVAGCYSVVPEDRVGQNTPVL